MHQFNALNEGLRSSCDNGVAVEAFINAIKEFIARLYNGAMLLFNASHQSVAYSLHVLLKTFTKLLE